MNEEVEMKMLMSMNVQRGNEFLLSSKVPSHTNKPHHFATNLATRHSASILLASSHHRKISPVMNQKLVIGFPSFNAESERRHAFESVFAPQLHRICFV
jgi:hypothetical protein